MGKIDHRRLPCILQDTTRAPCLGETEGRNAALSPRIQIHSFSSENAFIEHAQFFSNFTVLKSLRRVASSMNARQRHLTGAWMSRVAGKSRKPILHPVYVFISPPSMGVVRQRLRRLAMDPAEAVQKPLTTAIVQISYSQEQGLHYRQRRPQHRV